MNQFTHIMTHFPHIMTQLRHFMTQLLEFFCRILNAAYLDGIETTRRAVNKQPLPNARAVSHALTNFDEVLHENLTMAALQWGQFIEQDWSRPAFSPMCKYYWNCIII